MTAAEKRMPEAGGDAVPEKPHPASKDDDAWRGDRAYHLARVVAGLPTKVTDPERARRLARLLGLETGRQ